MKRMKLTLLALSGVIVLATSCKKENPTEINSVPTAASANALTNFFDQNESDKVQSFTIDASQNEVITGSEGTTITFYANSFETQGGSSVNGMIQIELTEVYSKKDMILLRKPTMGNLPTGGQRPLISGGEFNVVAKQNGQVLNLKPGMSYQIQAPAINGVDPQMGAFYGIESGDTLSWNPADSSIVGGQGNEYTGYFDSLNWINLDYFMDNTQASSIIDVQLPNGFNNGNCAVYISIDGSNSIAYVYSFVNGVFTTGPYYNLPIGMNVHFIAMAFINGVPHAAIVPATIENNHLEIISALNATTETQLGIDLSNLP